MRVLWFSNALFSREKIKNTGTWLYTMSEALVSHGIELVNISQSYRVKTVSRCDVGDIKQWVLPTFKLHHGLPNVKHIKEICDIVESVRPDIIHVWGIENYWGLLTARGYIKGNVLLEIQGIRETCARVFYGGLTFPEVVSTIKTKEFIKPSISLPFQKRKFRRWSRYEREIISGHKYINTQSDWVRSWVFKFMSPDANYFETDLIVRSQFLESKPWEIRVHDESMPVLFTLSSEAHAYKGLHDGIKGVAILKKKYPNISFRIAGNFEINRPNYKKNGYTKYLLSLIRKYGLSDNVKFLGALDAEALCQEMREADLMLQTSYVESYSLALVEAMAVGVPCVVSYAGAMPELARDGVEALYYTPSDYFKLAFLADKIICDKQLSASLSQNARKLSQRRNSPKSVVENQINIYNKVCGRL